MPNAITMLKADHTAVKRLLKELNSTTAPKSREQLVARIEREVKTHSQIEEEVFYPAYKAAAERTDKLGLVYEAAEEHHLVDIELPSLKAANPKSHEFEAKAKVLMDLLEHHIKEEEGQMFTAARQLFDDEQLRELGELMQARKETIEAMWESPFLRPMKKLQGVVQKLAPVKVKNAKIALAAKAIREEAR